MNELRAKAVIGATTLTAYFGGDIATLTAIAASQPVMDGDEQRMTAYLRRIAPPGSTTFNGGMGWIDAKGESRVSSSLADLDQAGRRLRPRLLQDGQGDERAVRQRGHRLEADQPPRRRHRRADARRRRRLQRRPRGRAQGQAGAAEPELGRARLQRTRDPRSGGQARSSPASDARRTARSWRVSRRTTRGRSPTGAGSTARPGRVIVWATARLAGWTVAIDRPSASVFAASRRALILDLALIAGLALILLSLIAWAARRAQREARQQQRAPRARARHRPAPAAEHAPGELPVVEGLDDRLPLPRRGRGHRGRRRLVRRRRPGRRARTCDRRRRRGTRHRSGHADGPDAERVPRLRVRPRVTRRGAAAHAAARAGRRHGDCGVHELRPVHRRSPLRVGGASPAAHDRPRDGRGLGARARRRAAARVRVAREPARREGGARASARR